MRQSKKVSLSAMLTALGVAFMALGYFVETLDLTACALASLLIALVYVEIGSPYTYLVWLCTSLLAFLFFSGSVIWLTYFLVFGIYPILKAKIERLPRFLWLILKLVYLNLILIAIFLVFELLFMTPFFETDNSLFKVGIWAFLNIAFVVYDLFITVIVRLYYMKYRRLFAKFFK